MNNYIEYFTNYIYKNYDMNDKLINLKYYHSLRVAKLMYILSKKMNLDEMDCILAFKLGLCHDLGRFFEVVRNGKFDNLVFDHGAYSNKILYNDLFINYMDINEHLLFRKAIYNHNKKDVTSDLNKREELFTHMLRDIDKLDIIDLHSKNRVYYFNSQPNKNVISNYFNDESIDIKDLSSKTDAVILYLSFFKDLYFKASHDLANDYNYFKNFIKIVEVDEEKEEIFNSLINKLNEERGKVYVR